MRRFQAAAAAMLLLSCQPYPGDGGPPCRVSRVTDGDTVTLVCDGAPRKVRLLDMDTPEIFHPRCARELAAGVAAREALVQLVQAGPVTAVQFQGHDRYDRDLGRISVAGRDLSAAMLRLGHARPYQGHADPNWCARG